MFFSSEDDFDRLDGKLFPRARMLERALRKMIPPLASAPSHRLAAA
jgi:hypothetical protein